MSIGKLVMTSSVVDQCIQKEGFFEFIDESLSRYIKRDWGDTCPEDAAQNNKYARNNKYMILAVYHRNGNPEETIWIITDAGGDITTILLPEDY